MLMWNLQVGLAGVTMWLDWVGIDHDDGVQDWLVIQGVNGCHWVP